MNELGLRQFLWELVGSCCDYYLMFSMNKQKQNQCDRLGDNLTKRINER